MTDLTTQPIRCFLGRSEIWRSNGTGTRDYYLFGIRVWRAHFRHSTSWWE